MFRALQKKKMVGFTLIELIMVIVILGILAAVAIPKLFDFSADAKRATCLGILGAVRTSIALYFSKNALPPPTGGSRPWWPNYTQMTSQDGGPGTVLESRLADNPFSTNANSDARNDVASVDLLAPAFAKPGSPPTTGAWAYDQQGDPGFAPGQPYSQPGDGIDVGQFWANTSTTGIGEVTF